MNIKFVLNQAVILSLTAVFILSQPSTGKAVFLPDADDSQQINHPQPDPLYEPDVVIIRFKEEVNESTLERLRESNLTIQSVEPVYKQLHERMKASGKTEQELVAQVRAKFSVRTQRSSQVFKENYDPEFRKVYKVKLQEGADVPAAIEILQSLPDIVWAQPNYIIKPDDVPPDEPDDPYFKTRGSWGQDYQDMWGLHRIHMEDAWDIEMGKDFVTVAVIDWGVDYNHPDIKANMWQDGQGNYGYDYANNDNDPMDKLGHGTHIAGTIAAVTNNGEGIAGVSWQTKIMAVKIGDTGEAFNDDTAQGIYYAIEHGADITNNSWGGDPDSFQNYLIEEAFAYASVMGVINVASAGNNTEDVKNHSPANLSYMITVASWTHSDTRANDSNWGQAIDVIAPGVDILSLRADALRDWEYAVGENYYRMSGTSMAAPHVSGVLALMLSVAPDLDDFLAEEILQETAEDVLEHGFDIYSGYGLLDAHAALVRTKEIFYPPPGYIQSQIDQADEGDTIFVTPGTYFENIDFKGKAITLKSLEGPEKTIIDGQGQGPVVIFQNGEDEETILDGFTLQNGFAPYTGGGGILCSMSSPTIKNCIIKNNQGEGAGIGLYSGSLPEIVNSVITENIGYSGIYSRDSSPSIKYCTITNNMDSGISSSGQLSPTIMNSIIWENGWSEIQGNASVTYSDVKGGWPGIGNINVDPQFVNFWGEGDYHLRNQSPLKDVGISDGIIIDIENDLRPLASGYDIGVDEYAPGTIFVYVVDGKTQAAIDSATVRIYDMMGRLADEDITSDLGRAIVKRQAAGSYTLKVEKENYHTLSRQVTGEEMKIELTPAGHPNLVTGKSLLR